MSFYRWDHNVLGCWPNPNFLQSRPGVYVVWRGNESPEKVVFVGEADDVLRAVTEKVRVEPFPNHGSGKTWYSVIYTEKLDPPDRREIASRIAQAEHISSPGATEAR